MSHASRAPDEGNSNVGIVLTRGTHTPALVSNVCLITSPLFCLTESWFACTADGNATIDSRACSFVGTADAWIRCLLDTILQRLSQFDLDLACPGETSSLAGCSWNTGDLDPSRQTLKTRSANRSVGFTIDQN